MPCAEPFVSNRVHPSNGHLHIERRLLGGGNCAIISLVSFHIASRSFLWGFVLVPSRRCVTLAELRSRGFGQPCRDFRPRVIGETTPAVGAVLFFFKGNAHTWKTRQQHKNTVVYTNRVFQLNTSDTFRGFRQVVHTMTGFDCPSTFPKYSDHEKPHPPPLRLVLFVLGHYRRLRPMTVMTRSR